MAHSEELLDKALKAHGGKRKWDTINKITARVRIGGLLPLSKLVSFALKRIEVTVTTKRPYTVISPYPSRYYKGVFARDTVYIESENGEIISERSNPRSYFKTFRHNLWWDDLDVLYFVGYASWNYLCTPFIFNLPGFGVAETEPWDEAGEVWRRLRVSFPDEIETHSKEQMFYFDTVGLIKRLDYTAEPVGSWANAAHYCYDHKDFDGLIVPTIRKVFHRKSDGRSRRFSVLVSLQVDDVIIN
jgi:hypothetical protein